MFSLKTTTMWAVRPTESASVPRRYDTTSGGARSAASTGTF